MTLLEDFGIVEKAGAFILRLSSFQLILTILRHPSPLIKPSQKVWNSLTVRAAISRQAKAAGKKSEF